MGSIPEISIIKGLNRDYSTHRLHRILEANLNSPDCGNKPAVIFSNRCDEDRQLTYNQLNQAANQLASVLIHRISTCELEPNSDGDWIIAVCMPPSDELIITLLAILKTGAAYLPIDITFPKSRIEHILQEAKPALVIYDNNAVECSLFGNAAAVSYIECKSLSMNYDDANISDARKLQSISGGHLALVLYTSGSTGIPKGVRLPHAVLMNRLQWQWETFPYSSTESIGIFKTALTFVDSISEIWGPLLTKRAILVVPKSVTKDPTKLVSVLENYAIERLVLVPTLLKSLLIYLSLKRDANLLSKLKLWVCSGETLPAALAMEFYDYFPENEYLLCNFYGSTEIMGDVTYFVCRGKEQLRNYTNVPIGYPIFNTIIYILDDEKKPVKIGETGELFVSGANLAHGYVNGRDKDRFIENVLAVDPKYSRLYRTGDYASVQKGGVIHYDGRTDSQIKIRGHRVDLSEIEKNLCEIDGVKKGIVLCYHAGQMNQTILAFASVDRSSLLHEMQIEKMLRNKLPDYMTPQVIIIDQVPLLVNGKVDRQTLLKLYENTNNNNDPEPSIDYDYTGVAPNEMEKARIFFQTVGEVIGRSARTTISLQSNFYELGGNSLNSIYTVAKLRDRGYSIEITDFISAKCLREALDYTNEIDIVRGNKLVAVKADFVAYALSEEHREETISMIIDCFMNKGRLESYLKPDINEEAYVALMNEAWDALIQTGFSFVITDKSNRIVGVSLSFDANNEPHLESSCASLDIISEFLESIETPARELLPKDKPIMHSYMMGTHESLNAQDNVVAMTFMESEVIRLAKQKCCCGILTTNTNALTQQLARDVFGYEILADAQINSFVLKANGRRPFGDAPDDYRAIINWKKL